jgi:hypothetical protein
LRAARREPFERLKPGKRVSAKAAVTKMQIFVKTASTR